MILYQSGGLGPAAKPFYFFSTLKCSMISAMSRGGGAVNVMGWPVSGWRMESDSGGASHNGIKTALKIKIHGLK